MRTEFTEQGVITLIEARGYKDAIEEPKITIEPVKVEITAGLPAKPPSEAEKSKGKGVKLWYWASVASFLAGIGAAFMKNYRLAGLLAGGGVSMGLLASLLASPWAPALGLVLVVGAGFLYWGYKIR